jgi:N-acetyl-anhydromuramyl-L-alanine amidase AmpD
VWHATAGHYAPSITWLCTPTVYNPDGSVKSGPDASVHLEIREDGAEATQLVHLAEKAWHAEAFNGFSVGVEHASPNAYFYGHAQFLESARVFGWLCWHLNIPPVFGLHKPKGIVRHRDLGLAGGGHSDGPPDHQWFGEYLPAVQHEVARGGFRKTWAL